MIPKYLKMQNFMSHDHSEIDFDRFDVALVLGKYGNETDRSNGAGKSAIFSAIEWALFGKSRHKKKDGVVKWDRKFCQVEFSFIVNDSLYKITRMRDKVSGESDLVLEQWNGVEFQSIECDTNTATEKKIIEIIGVSYDVFVHSVYFKQNDIAIFTNESSGQRKEVIKSLLKMDKWDLYQRKVKDYLKRLTAKIEEKETNVISIDKIDGDVWACGEAIKSAKENFDKYSEEMKKIEEDLNKNKYEFRSLYENGSNIITSLKESKANLLKTKTYINDIERRKKQNDSIIKECSTKIAELRQKMVLLSDKIELKKDVDLNGLRSKFMAGQTKKGIMAEEINNLRSSIKLSGKCDICHTPLNKDQVEKIKSERKIALDQLQEKFKTLCGQIDKASKILHQKENIVAQGLDAETNKHKAEMLIANLSHKIDVCIEDNNDVESKKSLLDVDKMEKEVAALELKANEHHKEELQKSIASLEEKAKKIRKMVDSTNIERGIQINKQKELVVSKSEQLALKKEIEKLNTEYSAYDKLRGYFGKDGIQSVIIENVTEELENYANDILAVICNEPTSISITTQKQNDNGSWAETFDIMVKSGSRLDDLDSYSGGEQFRVALSLRLALSNLLSKRMGGEVRFLLLDEVTSSLDEKGIDMFMNIVKKLSTHMKILVITHDEKLKERFDDVIMVNKGVNGSSAKLL